MSAFCPTFEMSTKRNTSKTQVMETMYCFKVVNTNDTFSAITNIFEMSKDDFNNNPESDAQFIDGEIVEPTLWGYDDYMTAYQIYKTLNVNSIHADRERIEIKSHNYMVEKRKEEYRKKYR